MTLLAIDPGKRIGYALFNELNGEEIERGVTLFDDWFKLVPPPGDEHGFRLQVTSSGRLLCNYLHITQLVVEGFRHDPNVKQGGSQHEASQVIGSVKTLALVAEIPVAVQYSNILPVAMMHAGYEPPKTRTGNKKHLPDEDSAWLHGRYWLTAQGVLS